MRVVFAALDMEVAFAVHGHVRTARPSHVLPGRCSGTPKLPRACRRSRSDPRQQPFEVVDSIHAIALNVYQGSKIQALDRNQTSLPLKPGRCETITRDYKRSGIPRRSSLSICSTTGS
jgi:hypothetical protein